MASALSDVQRLDRASAMKAMWAKAVIFCSGNPLAKGRKGRTVIGSITRQQLLDLLRAGEPIVLVEALGPAFFADAHLPGAINLPPAALGESIDDAIPDRDARIVVYCSRSCEMSLDMARRLTALGYTRVEHYPGGKEDWVEAGLPVERGTRSRPAMSALKAGPAPNPRR